MATYIEREAVLAELDSVVKDYVDEHTFSTDFAAAVVCELRDNKVATFPSADVVSKAVFDQVMWERNTAITQLREDYGVGLGEKKADVVPVADMKEFAADVAYQFGYKGEYKGRLHIMHGGLSTLERAFEILGWENPHTYPEGECEWDGCHEYATCGTPTPDGYKRVCGKHYLGIKAREEAERNARMDGE